VGGSPWYVCRLLKASTFPIYLSVTYPIHFCQRNAHVESAVSKVNSLWAVDENAIVERLHPVSATTLIVINYCGQSPPQIIWTCAILHGVEVPFNTGFMPSVKRTLYVLL